MNALKYYTTEEGALLLRLAGESIRHSLDFHRPLRIELEKIPFKLQEIRAAFVTLKRDGKLRGCIGTIEARRPLAEEVSASARSAAFSDPRFAPLKKEELQNLEIKISVLTQPVPIDCKSEAELFRLLRPGQDGLLIEADQKKATFLPEVWETLPDPAEFLAQLKLKAGLDPARLYKNLKYFRYGTETF